MTVGQMFGIVAIFVMLLVPSWVIIMPWASQVPRIGKPLSIALIILAAAWIATVWSCAVPSNHHRDWLHLGGKMYA